MTKVSENTPAPDFDLTNLQGETIRLSDSNSRFGIGLDNCGITPILGASETR
jgi:hypothetical protein